MKNLVLMSLGFCCGILLVYAFVAFVSWEMSPEQWGLSARFVAATMGIIFGMAFSAMAVNKWGKK